MKIAIVSSEAVPFAKTGGLADVAGALPAELANMGHDVRLIIPKYKSVEEKGFKLKKIEGDFTVPLGERMVKGSVLETTENNVKTLFIENDEFFMRDELYKDKNTGDDYSDNASRFIFFSRGVLSALKLVNFKPDIIHVNDWQSALIPLYLKSILKDDAHFKKTSTVLTVHNLGYQGVFWHHDMPLIGVGWEYYTPEGIEFYDKINFLKAGIIFSDVINTVSKKYAEQIQTNEDGFGLDGVLKDRKEDLFGIINGIDYDEWNPETDTFIAKNYSTKDTSGKAENKRTLLNEFYLPEKLDIPLIGIISRLADQKGFDILADAMEELMSMELKMVILGTGEKKFHLLLTELGKKHPTKLGIKLTYDNRLAHLIEAGSDIFLMPSRYEPCGLNQMMSMRYGTVPVVRATGGLDDTIVEFNEKSGEGNGIKFTNYDAATLISAVKRALSLYGKKPHWKKMMKNGMTTDFSWRASAKEYENLYKRAIKKKLP